MNVLAEVKRGNHWLISAGGQTFPACRSSWPTIYLQSVVCVSVCEPVTCAIKVKP